MLEERLNLLKLVEGYIAKVTEELEAELVKEDAERSTDHISSSRFHTRPKVHVPSWFAWPAPAFLNHFES
jgi:hypothetical protein